MSSISSTSLNTSIDQDPCNKLLLWTQYGPTCWFNTVLTVLFHSQYSRDMILKLSKDWKDKSTMQKLAEHIVKYKYIQSDSFERDRLFYYKVRPENILDYLHTKYPEYVKKNAGKSGGDPNRILNKIYEILNIKCLSFEICNDYLYYNIYNHYKFDFDDSYPIVEKNINLINKLENTHKNPEVILLKTDNLINKYYLYENFKHYNLEDKIDPTNISQLKSLKDTIEYNGNKYILDSIILINHNKADTAHAIAGITCNKNKYVYNGWTNNTNDPALKTTDNKHTNIPNIYKKYFENINIKTTDKKTTDKKTTDKKTTDKKKTNIQEYYKKVAKQIPCDLIKFDWYKNKNDFCIKNCNLPEFNGEKLCFNFGKGICTYIYIREDLYVKDKDIELDTQKFVKFIIPKDFRPKYNTLPEKYNNTNILTNYDNIYDIIEELMENSDKYNYKIIFIINYLKKYINQINNYINQIKNSSKSELISSIIYFKYTVILFYIIYYDSNFFEIDYNIENFESFFNDFLITLKITLKKEYESDSTILYYKIKKDIKTILENIKYNEDEDDDLYNKLFYYLHLYYKNIENEYITKLGLIDIYTKYIDDEIIINYLFDLKKLIYKGNIDKSKYSINMLNDNISLELETFTEIQNIQEAGSVNDINILKEFIRRIIY
jgi:hypothetical protein